MEKLLSFEEAKKIVDHGMEKLFSTVPMAKEFHQTDWIDADYYRRHVLECVLRIEENNRLDAYAITQSVSKHSLAMKDFSYYLYDELGHDDLFYNDLKVMGLSKQQVQATETFFSTKLLMGFLNYEVAKEGALPAIMWDWFLEYYSQNYNVFITAKAEKLLGRKSTKGASSHNNTDSTEDHPNLMFGLVKKIIKTPEDEAKARFYLEKVVDLVGMYFQELSDATNQTKKAS